ncbi:MAG TPA: putative toxin-antitoxin system toxin component, PIN family [Chloroflexia bacterium]|nr:putative toxin-antitoxin system toxin component, PIN family [Chloroflexia bacterium]
MLRVLLDANVYISYLLAPDAPGTIQQLMSAALEGRYTLLLPRELLAEMSETLSRKQALSRRTNPQERQKLLSRFMEIAEKIDTIREEIPTVTRDRKDDYLLAYAVIGQVDYLVTGDMDLLVLDHVGPVQIVRPADFLAVLSRQSPS